MNAFNFVTSLPVEIQRSLEDLEINRLNARFEEIGMKMTELNQLAFVAGVEYDALAVFPNATARRKDLLVEMEQLAKQMRELANEQASNLRKAKELSTR